MGNILPYCTCNKSAVGPERWPMKITSDIPQISYNKKRARFVRLECEYCGAHICLWIANGISEMGFKG